MSDRREGIALSAHYDRLASKFEMVDRRADYASLVVPSGNDRQPIHRWFRYKEAYSHQLVERLLKDDSYSGQTSIRLIDPFAGSGTSLVSALAQKASQPIRVIGIERNPFVHAVALAKSAAAVDGALLLGAVNREAPSVRATYSQLMRGWRSLTTHSPTLNNTAYFPESHVRSLLALGRATADIEEPRVRAVFQTCVASAIEPAGNLRRDGRALRLVERRSLTHPLEAFESAVAQVTADLSCLDSPAGESEASVLEGDAREELDGLAGQDFNWAIFSPPYPNNIDYTEVYKLEGWVLGFYSGPGDVRQQRLKTLRSHPSVLFPDVYLPKTPGVLAQMAPLLSPVLSAIPADRYAKGRTQLVRGYFADMFQVFHGLRRALAAGGRVACVVGNSVHGSGESQFVIASDVLLAAVAELAGLEVDEIRIARELHRRGRAPHIRESVVMLKNGECSSVRPSGDR